MASHQTCEPHDHTERRHLLDGVVHVHHVSGGAWCCIDYRKYPSYLDALGQLNATTRPVTCFWCLTGLLGVSE